MCEPQLGKRGLYSLVGGRKDESLDELALLWVLNLSDSTRTLLDIAERSGLEFASVRACGGRARRVRAAEGGRVRVVVTGSEGYIGSVLCPYLVERGHDVVGVDSGFYRSPLALRGTVDRGRDVAQGHPPPRGSGPRRRRRDRAHGRALQRPASGSSRPTSPTRSTTAAPSTSPRRRRPPAFPASSTRRPAASTARRTRSSSTRSRRSARRRRTRSARSSSSATSR